MQVFPDVKHSVMNSVVNHGQKIYVVGYKYYSNKVICFISSEGKGDSRLRKPYEAGCIYLHGNVHSHLIYCPYIISA